MTEAIEMSKIISERPKVFQIFKIKEFLLKRVVEIRKSPISLETSNKIFSKSLKPLYQLISWVKWMTESIKNVKKFALKAKIVSE